MKKLQKDDPEKYKRQFATYIAKNVQPQDMEALYTKVHAAIRAKPQRPRKKADAPKKPTYNKKKRALSLQQREGKVAQRKLAAGLKVY